ncbi:MAG: hypothetical protein QXR60_05625 [Candidatus Nanoarchaeia archaeon]
MNGTTDFVWVQISISLPQSPDSCGVHTGAIFIYFEASSYGGDGGGGGPCYECGAGHVDNGDGTCTATLNNPTEDGYIRYDVLRDRTIKYSASELIYIGVSFDVYRGYVEWEISSIPDSSIINNVVFRYHGASNNIDCHIHEMVGTRPSTSGAQAIYNEAAEGTVYADENGFPVVGTNKQINLGANACTDLQSLLGSNWFAIGIQSDSEVTSAVSQIYSEEYSSASPKPILVVTYTPPSC